MLATPLFGAALALAASPAPYSTAWSSQAALQTLSALRERTSSRPLDLLEDLYDAESGLCSEGVWQNSWLGIGQIYAARRESGDAAAAHLDRARRLADSLHELNYEPDRGFRSRTRSGFWQAADADALARAGENPAFYEPDATCRCSANAAAVILHTFLLEESPGDAAVAARAAAVFDTFTASFFDSDTMRWSREAASAGGELRAADAAAAVLACLRLVKVGHSNPAISRAMASCAADALLRDTGFGYSGYASPSYTPPRNPLGASTAGRNSWHDAFVALALLVGDALGAGGDSADALLDHLEADYAPDGGLLAHLPVGLPQSGTERCAYTSTQAIWTAALRAGGRSSDAFCAELQARWGGAALLPVANVYPDARLWANTEAAAFLLLEPSDFRLG